MTTRTLAALALLLVVALAAPTALADDPDQPLGPTQIAGDLPPPETNGTAIIQWGGGNLYQLTARLAVNGCDLNLLWVYDDQTQKYTAAYTFDGPSFLNAPFELLYGDGIPPTTLWIQCIDMIEHVYGYGLLDARERNHVDSLEKGTQRQSTYSYPTTGCGDHWFPQTASKVLPILPVPQHVCVTKATGSIDPAYDQGGSYSDNMVSLRNAWYFRYLPKVGMALIPLTWPQIASQKTEIHELCHANQHWHALKTMTNLDVLAESSSGPLRSDDQVSHSEDSLALWYASEATKLFIDIVGFRFTNKQWELPKGSVYNEGIYTGYGGTQQPHELSAELCAGYLMSYANIEYDGTFGGTFANGLYNNYKPFLTPEVFAWLEQYVFVLPESRLTRRIEGRVVDEHGRSRTDVGILVCPASCAIEERLDHAGRFAATVPPTEFHVEVRLGGDTRFYYTNSEPPGLTRIYSRRTLFHAESPEAQDITIVVPRDIE